MWEAILAYIHNLACTLCEQEQPVSWPVKNALYICSNH